MAKKIKSYNLDEEVIRYIEQVQKENNFGSASWALNHLLTQLALKDSVNTKNKKT